MKLADKILDKYNEGVSIDEDLVQQLAAFQTDAIGTLSGGYYDRLVKKDLMVVSRSWLASKLKMGIPKELLQKPFSFEKK